MIVKMIITENHNDDNSNIINLKSMLVFDLYDLKKYIAKIL